MKFYLKVAFCAFVVVGILIAGFYWRENRRGAAAWEATKARLEAEGETLKFADLIPPMPPDEENFCAVPLVASMVEFEKEDSGRGVYRDPRQHERIAAMVLPSRLPTPERRNPKRANFQNGDLPDLEWWAELFREEAGFEVSDPDEPAPMQVLSALDKFEAEFAELAAAADRPQAVFSFDWPEEGKAFQFMAMPDPQFTDIIELGKVLKLRGVAALAAGRPEVARESINIMFRLADAVESKPHLVSKLVAVTTRVRSLAVIWYGLRQQGWRESDLLWLERELEFPNCFDSAANAFRSEMLVYQVFFHDSMKDMGYRGAGYQVVFPDGYWDLAKSEGCRYLYGGIIRPLKMLDHSALVSLGGFPLPKETVYNESAIMMFPGIEMHGRNLVMIKTMGQLAQSACALERYFQKTGDYPESDWRPLIPKFLTEDPIDPLDGKPIRYQRTDEGRYRVYSIGANLVDDGGHIVFEPNRAKPNYQSGDWVWGYSFPERNVSEEESAN